MPDDPTTTGTITLGEIDPMLTAIRQAIIDAQSGVLAEFGERQVVIVSPDETEKSINQKIGVAMGKQHGLALLLIAGSGINPDPEAPGPLLNLTLEMQLFISTAIRGRAATAPLALVVGLARILHQASLGVTEIDWYETIRFMGFDPLADDEFTAYALRFERDMAL